jgi:hypothetical protein
MAQTGVGYGVSATACNQHEQCTHRLGVQSRMPRPLTNRASLRAARQRTYTHQHSKAKGDAHALGRNHSYPLPFSPVPAQEPTTFLHRELSAEKRYTWRESCNLYLTTYCIQCIACVSVLICVCALVVGRAQGRVCLYGSNSAASFRCC